ncbi:hypothetical protein GGR53DRAFT_27107 [Hypoxylon sp. FL1150]|nr:hypothetical protein GGR53DRAFT_27107 [Hypoxylon sp. FL1150]
MGSVVVARNVTTPFLLCLFFLFKGIVLWRCQRGTILNSREEYPMKVMGRYLDSIVALFAPIDKYPRCRLQWSGSENRLIRAGCLHGPRRHLTKAWHGVALELRDLTYDHVAPGAITYLMWLLISDRFAVSMNYCISTGADKGTVPGSSLYRTRVAGPSNYEHNITTSPNCNACGPTEYSVSVTPFLVSSL